MYKLVGWAGDSQPNKTHDCIGFMLNVGLPKSGNPT